jgi:imidazolonepropionase-like amidohydrolase
MLGAKPVLLEADSYKEIKEALRFAEHFGLRVVLIGGRDGWKLADELAAKKIDVILTGSMTLPTGFSEPWDSVYRNAAELDRAGVRFCITTGGTRPGLEKLVGVEAGMAVAYGLDAGRALESITIDAARILGVDDRIGSLEVGKVADVIVTTDSPMQAGNRVVAVFIGGRPMDLSSKHSRLDVKFRSRPEPKLDAIPELRGPPAIGVPRATVGSTP